jgi:hypothetical protein
MRGLGTGDLIRAARQPRSAVMLDRDPVSSAALAMDSTIVPM